MTHLDYATCKESPNLEHRPAWKTARHTDAPVSIPTGGDEDEQYTAIDVNCQNCGQSGAFPVRDADVQWA